MTSTLDQLPKRTQVLARSQLAEDEEVVAVLAGRSKQAMIVTDRQVLIVKPGWMAGAALGTKAGSFPFARGSRALSSAVSSRPLDCTEQ
jgi:hypothetical protein